MDPDQISGTYVSIRPIILSHCRNSLSRCHNQSQPMWYPTKCLKQTSGISWSLTGLDHLHHQMPRIPLTFTTYTATDKITANLRRVSLKYWQPIPGFSNPALRILWDRLKYWLTAFLCHARHKHCPFDSLKIFIVYLLCLCGTRNLFC